MNAFVQNIRFNFLYIDLYSFGKTWIYPESRIPYNLLRYVVDGKAVFFIDGKEVTVKPGDIVYLPQGCKLSCHALNDDLQFYSIRFVSSANYEGGDLLSDYYCVPTVTPDVERGAKEYFEKIYSWIKTEDKSRMFWVRGYLDLLIGYIVNKGSQTAKDQVSQSELEEFTFDRIKTRIKKSDTKIDPRIQVVVDYMVLHPIEQYTLKRMSQMAELSESRFRTLFKQQIGKNPLEYLNELRVMAAARKLLLSGDNISDIGYSLGFEDSNYFIRVFKKYFCVTPKQYRDNAKE